MELKNARMDQMKKGVKMVSFYVSLLLSSSSNLISLQWLSLSLDFANVNHWPGEGGGGTLPSPLYGLYGDMPLDRVWFSLSVSYTGYIISSESVSLHDLFAKWIYFVLQACKT